MNQEIDATIQKSFYLWAALSPQERKSKKEAWDMEDAKEKHPHIDFSKPSWEACIMDDDEVSVCHTTFIHGWISRGWFGDMKRHVGNTGTNGFSKSTDFPELLMPALVKIAEEVRDRLNAQSIQ